MKSSKLTEILMDGNIVILIYILHDYRELKVNSYEFYFIMYLYNNANEFSFNVIKICHVTGINIS